MDIFSLVNKNTEKNEEDKTYCILNDEIFLEESSFFKPLEFRLDIASLKKITGDMASFRICYAGKLVFRAGALVEGKSWVWLMDKRLESGKPVCVEFAASLAGLETGSLEIELYAVEDSVLYDVSPLAEEAVFEPANVLYNFVSPSFNLCHEIPLYYHFPSVNAWYSFEDGHVYLKKGASADLLTYFNSFSCEKWRKYTNVDQLSLYLDFKGEALAELLVQTHKGAMPIASWRLLAPQRKRLELPLNMIPETGILGLRLYALSYSALYGGGYFTAAKEERDVRLGIGITSFRREDAVRGAVKRLREEISRQPYYKDKIQITVVDNGQTLQSGDVAGAALIPNRNLGGSGGFMRSLIHYKEAGEVTHCLFMDDDAACEASSIFRAMSFLRHAIDERAAISGAMLSENIKFMQWECGAWFDGGCHPLKCDYDLRDPSILTRNETENSVKEIYGAWWFFMFPIKLVKRYSFPFFVRGDDIEFSYLNDFKVITLNGVGVWQEDFKTKEGPHTLYFDIRSHVLHHLVLPQTEDGKWQIIKMVYAFFNRFNDSYQYDTAKSIVMAFNDMQRGPQYWLQNMDASAIRKKMADLLTYERKKPLTLDLDKIKRKEPKKPGKMEQALKKVSLNGHLLPGAFFGGTETISAYEMPNAERTFLKKKVLVYNTNTGRQWLLGRNSKYYFLNKARFYMASLKFLLRYGSLQGKYREFYKTLENDAFWKQEFEKER